MLFRKVLLTFVIFVGNSNSSIIINALLVNQIGYVKVVTILCRKNKMTMQDQLHKMELCPKFIELDWFCPIE